MLKLVPEATTEQITSFLHIAEEDYGKKKEAAVPKDRIAQPDAVASQLAWLKKELKSVKQSRVLDSPTVVDSQFMKQLQKLVPPADGGTGSELFIPSEARLDLAELGYIVNSAGV